ncbi:MAG: hypothetical protein V4724_22665 [Pseudomonadota bacterium]
MAISNEKIKATLKASRKKGASTSRKDEIEQAIIQLRRMRRSDSKEQDNLNVVVNDHMVLVQPKKFAGGGRSWVHYHHPNTISSTANLTDREQLADTMSSTANLTAREQLAIFNEQMRQLREFIENSHSDRVRMVQTLTEAPSPEAMEFYRSVAKI